MKAYTLHIDDDMADTYADEARERGTSVEALMTSTLLEGADAFGDLLSREQRAMIEAGLSDAREGRTVSQEEASGEVRKHFGW